MPMELAHSGLRVAQQVATGQVGRGKVIQGLKCNSQGFRFYP